MLADSHQGLAPAVIGCGELDPLRDEGLAYADALATAGVPVSKQARAHIGRTAGPRPSRPCQTSATLPTARPLTRRNTEVRLEY
ncbi:alpha/beta hydrolase fold domain-containing protein [Streptomyces sp. P1-3]|uniref:alpha/beta hydrolase fold domain-containing protein n=1 Tax=Streptomyces sp. P1-3 TaxID=3421658 RepID=UPI003D368830